MQAVILAAGRGTRMKDLTENISKPMLTVNGKTLIQHKLDILPPEIDNVVIVVGYQKDRTISEIGYEYGGKKIQYVVQETLDGTGGALWRCKDVLHDKFLVLMGDDIYAKEDLEEMLKGEWSILTHYQKESFVGGNIIQDDEGNLKSIIEGPSPNGGVANAGAYLLDNRIFNYELVKLFGKEEYGLPQTMTQAVGDVPIKLVPSTLWLQITSPEDIEKVENFLSNY